MQLQRETQALQQDKGPLSPGRLRAARAGRLLRSGMAAAAAAAAAVASPMRRVQAGMFTATPQKPSRPVPARESGVEAASVVAAAGAQEQRVVAEGERQSGHAREGDDREQQSMHAREGDDREQQSVHAQEDDDQAASASEAAQGDSFAQMLQMLQRMQESQARMQESQARMHAEVQLVREEVQQVRTEVRTGVEQRVHEVEASQAQLRAQIVGVEATLEQLAKYKESASAHMQQLKQEQGERILAIEQQLLQHRDEEEKFRGNEIRVVRQEVQQILDEHLRVNEQQFIGREGQLKIVEQHNHGKELEEQAMQELQDEVQMLRKEQERLREEQEKMKGNEKRICAKIEQYMRASAKLVKEEAIDPLLAKFEQGRLRDEQEQSEAVELAEAAKDTRKAKPSAALPSLAEMEMFKLKPGEWDCSCCWTRNESYVVRCMSCEIGRAPDAPERGSKAFGQRFYEQRVAWEKILLQRASAVGAPISDSRWTAASAENTWLCRVCWSRHKSDVVKCMTCVWLGVIRASAENADSLPQEMPARVSEMLRQKDERDSDDDSDDGRILQVQHEDLSEIVECKQIEFNEPESFQFREAFEAGRELAHENTAFNEGYKYGEAEAAENWKHEYQIGEPYSSESEGDSVLSEREAAHSEAESVISGEREVARSESEAEDGRWHDDDDRESDEDK